MVHRGSSLHKRLLVAAIAALALAPAFACGGGGGSNRPGKAKTIVGGVPDGYEPSVCASVSFWSSRWQVLQYSMMSGAGTTEPIESSLMDWYRYLAEPSNGSNPAIVPSNAAYVTVPIRYGMPTYALPSDDSFMDFGDERWSAADGGSMGYTSTVASYVTANVMWARQFAVVNRFGSPDNSSFGSTERLQGLIMAELAKRSTMYYLNNRSLFVDGSLGRLRMIASLSQLARLLRDTSIGGGSGNRYRDVNFASQLLAWMDFLFEEQTSDAAPSTADGLSEAIVTLGWYATTTLDAFRRTQATTLIRSYADALTVLDSTDPFDNACRIRGLVEAGRLLFAQSYLSTAGDVFKTFQASYIPETGLFVGRDSLTSYELSKIVGALNAASTIAPTYLDAEYAQVILSDLCAATLYLGGMYRSTFPISVVSSFERPTRALDYAFPNVPLNRETGGNGTAPYFATRVVKRPDSLGWVVENTSFDAVGSLYLAIELLGLRPNEINLYPNYNSGVSGALRYGRADFSYPVARSEGYIAGRTALIEYALRAGVGDTFSLTPDVNVDIVTKSSTPSTGDIAILPTNIALLRIPYDLGSPAWRTPYNANPYDYGNFRWTPAGNDKTEAALATLISAEVRLARHFADERHFGASGTSSFGSNERLKGFLLYYAIHRQLEDLFAGSYPMSRTVPGRALLVEAMCEASSLMSSVSLPGSATNVYRDATFAAAIDAQIETTFDFLVSSDLPDRLDDLRKFERGVFLYALHAPTIERALGARNIVLACAQKALDTAATDARQRADLLLMLADALRMNAGGEFPVEMRKTFVLLLDEYDPAYGYFSSLPRYTAEDIGTISEALTAANLWGGNYIDPAAAESLLRGFVEGTMILSGSQRSQWAILDFPSYEITKPDIYYRYPSLPLSLTAGGNYGIAPVLAGQVEFAPFGSYWNILDTLSHTEGLLYTADVLMRMNYEEIPPLDVPAYLK